ncbi:monovalent cation/H(+) antiporter subunit G [soil metagenome]
MTELFTSISMLAGAAFMLLAAIGIIRMPDVYTRLQASTKAATLGAALILVGIAVHFDSMSVATRTALVISFLVLTIPVSAHMIGRAAYVARTPLWDGTVIDELGDDLRNRLLRNNESPVGPSEDDTKATAER